MTEQRTDISTLLRLAHWPAYLMMGLFTLSNALNTFATLDQVKSAPIAILAFTLVTIGAALLLIPAPDPYPAPLTAAVATISVAVSFAAWNLPDNGRLGWASWIWGGAVILLFFVTLRGRVLVSWVAFALHVAITIWWAVDIGRGIEAGISYVIRHAGLLLIVTLFTLLLRRTLRSLRTVHEAGLRRSSEEAAARAALTEQQRRIDRLHQLAGGALARIASEDRLTDSDRQEFLLIDGTIRDWLRGGQLATDAVIEASRIARRRGITVTLLDDAGNRRLSDREIDRVSTAVVDVLRRASAGAVTARLLPPGREAIASIRAGDGDVINRIDIAAAPPRP